MGDQFTVTRTAPTTYLDEHNSPIEGYIVYVVLTQWNEGHMFNVPTLDIELIEKRALELVEAREALDALGG